MAKTQGEKRNTGIYLPTRTKARILRYLKGTGETLSDYFRALAEKDLNTVTEPPTRSTEKQTGKIKNK